MVTVSVCSIERCCLLAHCGFLWSRSLLIANSSWWVEASAACVEVSSALHLPRIKRDAHLRQNLPRLLQTDVMRLFDHNFPSSAALRYGPMLRVSTPGIR